MYPTEFSKENKLRFRGGCVFLVVFSGRRFSHHLQFVVLAVRELTQTKRTCNLVFVSPSKWGCVPSKWPNFMAYKWGLLTIQSSWDDPPSKDSELNRSPCPWKLFNSDSLQPLIFQRGFAPEKSWDMVCIASPPVNVSVIIFRWRSRDVLQLLSFHPGRGTWRSIPFSKW